MAAIPSLAVFWSAARILFLLAAVASVAALAGRGDFFRRPLGAALGFAALAASALPSQISSPAEFTASWLPGVAALAWIGFCALFLLADHPAAWVLFGAIAFGRPLVEELLSQGAQDDRVSGSLAALLLTAAVVLAIAGRREAAPAPAAAGSAAPPVA